MKAEFRKVWADMTKGEHIIFITLLGGAITSATIISIFIAKVNSMPIELFAKVAPVGIILAIVFVITFCEAMRMLWTH